MAYVQHSGEGRDSLSHDFNYLESDILSFTMHAVANSSKTAFRNTLHSRTGVAISFLNFLNVPLGNISLVNATNPSSLGSHSITIDSAQHVYSAPMSEFAKVAGLGSGDPITKVSLEFFTTADFWFGGNIYPSSRSSAKVWLDNVTISSESVPSPVVKLEDNLDLTINPIDVFGTLYNVKLENYTNPKDLNNYYWRLASYCISNFQASDAYLQENWRVTLSPINVFGVPFDAILQLYSNPDDPENLYWKLQSATPQEQSKEQSKGSDSNTASSKNINR